MVLKMRTVGSWLRVGPRRVLDVGYWTVVVVLAVVLGSRVFSSVLPRDSRPVVDVARLQEGDNVPNVEMIVMSRAAGRRSTMLLSELWKESCVALVFFDPYCAVCRELASRWQGRRNLGKTGGVRIHWISINVDDDLVNEFQLEYGLPTPVLRVTSIDDSWRIGVVRTPTLYWIDTDGKLKGPLSTDAAEASATVSGCGV